MLRPGARQRAEIRKPGERQVHLERRAFGAKTADGFAKFGIELAFFDQPQKRDMRIEVGGHDGRIDFFAVFEDHAAHASATRHNALNRRVDADLGAVAACRLGDGFGDGSHAAAHESPKTALAANAAHAVMQKDVRGAGRTRTAICADDAVGGQRNLDFGRFEPFVEEIGGALREDFDQANNFAAAQLEHARTPA